MLFRSAGRTREAVVEAEESIRNNPNDLSSRRILGRIYSRMIGDPQTRYREDPVRIVRAVRRAAKGAKKGPVPA